ncbi:hypothetical protein TSOC_012395 [Tetrabaena socialis]|uniref:Uncharacterized protein n=1 Tax=Tetrabaena socialis TaxID=47790 RepID=A0A2J7ZN55_9CHLO|nr:hypothetical protein TSOC_012395 [Tetrabaena socialis]|eukprot:PNH01699.1 hypothetical protein TSOC_012395 [Tetrabaena socialis]
MSFSAAFQSPLARATQTADVVLQGLLKHEGKALYGAQYAAWQKAPEAFEIDGHAPVRELWHRASLAWRGILAAAPQPQADAVPTAAAAHPTAAVADPWVALVVAHNAINQGLVAIALGLPPSYFRRLPQNNAALSVIQLDPAQLQPAGNGHTTTQPPVVTLVCLNQSPDNPFKNPDKVAAQVVLVSPSTAGAGEGAAAGRAALAGVLGKLRVTHVLAAPTPAATETAHALLAGQVLPAAAAAAVDAAAAGSSGAAAVLEQLGAAEALDPAALWRRAVAAAGGSGAGPEHRDGGDRQYGNVVVVVDEAVHAAVLWAALGTAVPGDGGPRIRVSAGGLSVLEFAADPRVTPAAVRCVNNTAHLPPPEPAA